jgi:hypothetical protein
VSFGRTTYCKLDLRVSYIKIKNKQNTIKKPQELEKLLYFTEEQKENKKIFDYLNYFLFSCHYSNNKTTKTAYSISDL